MKFRYKRYEVPPSQAFPEGVLYRPEFPIRIIGSAGEASIRVLADTGADQTLLPRSVGNAIGASLAGSAQPAQRRFRFVRQNGSCRSPGQRLQKRASFRSGEPHPLECLDGAENP